MNKRKPNLQVQFVTDAEGNKTAVILSIELFESMVDAIEEYEDHYLAHHPQTEEIEIDLKPFEFRKRKGSKLKQIKQ